MAFAARGMPNRPCHRRSRWRRRRRCGRGRTKKSGRGEYASLGPTFQVDGTSDVGERPEMFPPPCGYHRRSQRACIDLDQRPRIYALTSPSNRAPSAAPRRSGRASSWRPSDGSGPASCLREDRPSDGRRPRAFLWLQWHGVRAAGRKNRPMQSGSHSLGEFSLNVVRIDDQQCGRAGRYWREPLMDRFNQGTYLPDAIQARSARAFDRRLRVR